MSYKDFSGLNGAVSQATVNPDTEVLQRVLNYDRQLLSMCKDLPSSWVRNYASVMVLKYDAQTGDPSDVTDSVVANAVSGPDSLISDTIRRFNDIYDQRQKDLDSVTTSVTRHLDFYNVLNYIAPEVGDNTDFMFIPSNGNGGGMVIRFSFSAADTRKTFSYHYRSSAPATIAPTIGSKKHTTGTSGPRATSGVTWVRNNGNLWQFMYICTGSDPSATDPWVTPILIGINLSSSGSGYATYSEYIEQMKQSVTTPTALTSVEKGLGDLVKPDIQTDVTITVDPSDFFSLNDEQVDNLKSNLEALQS